MYKPKPETLACLWGSAERVLQSGLFKVHWFLNTAQMQKHSWEVQDQIMIPAVLSLPKGEVAFASPGFLQIMKSCPLLLQVKLLAKVWFCRWILSSALCLLGRFSTVLPSPGKRKSPGLGGARDRSVWWGAQLWADGRVDLFLFRQQ